MGEDYMKDDALQDCWEEFLTVKLITSIDQFLA